MLPSSSRGLLALALGAGTVVFGLGRPAFADDEEEEEDDATAPSDEEEEVEKDQPSVTSGGLFTLKSYPINELLRPLTMTQNIAQVRISTGTDVSAKGAFKSAGVSLEGLYGFRDNVMGLGGFTSAYNFKQFSVYAGVETSLAYDLVDFRIAGRVGRVAAARFETVEGMDGMPQVLPNGEYDAGDAKFSLDIGFPFRYAFKPEFAVIALQTLMTIDFMEVDGNKATPDLNPSLGIATNPIPELSVVAFAQLQVIDFDTSAENFKVPVTGRVQFSPNQKLDIGLEFTLLNIKPPEGQSAIDNRFLALFAQFRMGK